MSASTSSPIMRTVLWSKAGPEFEFSVEKWAVAMDSPNEMYHGCALKFSTPDDENSVLLSAKHARNLANLILETFPAE